MGGSGDCLLWYSDRSTPALFGEHSCAIAAPIVIAAATGLVTAGLLLPASPANAAAPYRVAITYDSATVANWLHVDGTGTAPTAALTTSGTGTVTRTTWTTATIPSYVASVPGVVAGDQKVGVFPAYAASGNNFAAVKVTPNAFGANDVLAPGTKKLEFGADIKFNSPMPGTRAADNGNNVIQRGISTGDQFKIQVDSTGGGTVFNATCILRDGGTVISEAKVSTTNIAASTWYRLFCSRTTVAGKDSVTLSVQNLDAGTPADTKTVAGSALTNLDYGTASATTPIPLTMGAKVNNGGNVDSGNSDQFNGRIDNGYMAIDWP